jgi:RNA polymerase sigma-70 factor (ECF subfamily)
MTNGQWIDAAVKRYEAPLMVYAARLLHDPDRARDVVQDVFTRLCAQDANQVGPVLAQWLYTVCRNRALDVRRKEKRIKYFPDGEVELPSEAALIPSDVAERRDTSQQVARLMRTLSDDQQEVIRLRFEHGLSYQQIAHVTGHTISNVGVLIHTAIKKLRLQIGASEMASGTGSKRS